MNDDVDSIDPDKGDSRARAHGREPEPAYPTDED